MPPPVRGAALFHGDDAFPLHHAALHRQEALHLDASLPGYGEELSRDELRPRRDDQPFGDL